MTQQGDTPTDVTHSYTRTATFSAVRFNQNQGFFLYPRVAYRVEAEFEYHELDRMVGLIPGESYANEVVDDWLDQYLADKDLDTVFTFPLSGGVLADYLLTAFRGQADTIVAVTVTTIETNGALGADRWTARVRPS